MEIKATFRSALDRMREFDSYIFTSACAAYYMWIEKSDPAMFEEIRARVKEGRWCIVGGMLVQPDCNMPSGESFARHMLISQRYFREKFGVIAKTGYNVDSFGHNGNMPMLLQNGGMENYTFMRPEKREKELPESLFIWESDDGSRVKAYRIPLGYNITEEQFHRFDEIATSKEPCAMMAFYGIGNHGGGPTVSLLQKMEAELDERFVFSSPDKYFEAVRHEEIPILHDDLQFHAKGCYSAHAKIKQDNRKCENMLDAAERFSVLAGKLTGTPYPSRDLRRAWLNMLFNQFHDILCGCSIKEAYADAAMSHGESMAIAQRETNFAIQQIAWHIDTIGEGEAPRVAKKGLVSWIDTNGLGTPLVVFNPLAHPVNTEVEIGLLPTIIRDASGAPVPQQTVRASRTNVDDKYNTLIKVSLPAYGYQVFRLHYDTEAAVGANPFTCNENMIDNGKLRVVFDQKTGELTSITDLQSGRELLSGASSAFLVDETHCDTWAHGVRAFRDVVDTCTVGEISLLEKGPVRATIRSVQRIANSCITRDYCLTADSDVITVKTKIDFHEKHRMLKFSLPVNVKNGQTLCEIPFGKIERPNDGTEQVCGKWFLMREGDVGLCVANDSKYSFDAMGNTLTLTVLRGTIYADHFGREHRDEFCPFMDQGEHEFTYTVFPYHSLSDTARRSAELNHKPEWVIDTFHKGALPLTYTGIAVDADNLCVTAIKAQEDGKGTVLRLYETEGRDTEAHITLLGTSFKVCVPHNSVKTVLISPNGTIVTDFLE